MIQKAMLISTLRYKPVVIECIQYTGENILEIEKFSKPYEIYEKVYSTGYKSLSIQLSVHNSPRTVCMGDWVIRIDTWRDIVPQYDFDKSYEIIDA